MSNRYTCENCGEEFKKKCNYITHKNRKKPCSPKILQKQPEIFEHLYYLLQTKSVPEFRVWLTDEPWIGKDKQESIFRMFAVLNMFSQLEGFTVSQGNFSKGEIEALDFEKFWGRKIKDTGDKSDLALFRTDELLIFSSKNYETYKVGELGIDAIKTHYEELYSKVYSKLKIGIVVDDRKKLEQACAKAHTSSHLYVKTLRDPDTVILDNTDLIRAFKTFKTNFTSKIPKKAKKCLTLYFHQELMITMLSHRLQFSSKVLCSAISRSGKTYIMGGMIKKNEPKNVLIVTLRPSETIDSYRDFFTIYDFSEYNLAFLDGGNKKPKLGQKNIIVVSKQFLQGGKEEKLKAIKWLTNLHFDLVFIDEPHDGGSTQLATEVYQTYGGEGQRILFTSTYNKPANVYRIPRKCIVGWDMEDILLCKNFDGNTEESLVKRHGEIARKVLRDFSQEDIRDTYSRYPEMIMLSDHLEKGEKEKLLQLLSDEEGYGWSLKSLFATKSGSFIKEEEVTKYMVHLFGRNDEVIPDDTSILAQFSRYSRENGSRSMSVETPLTVLVFISPEKVATVSRNIKKILEKLYGDELEILCVNSEEKTGKASDAISGAEKRAKNQGKKATVIIASKMCTTGITIKKCDIVLMLDNCKSYDEYYQKIFRCMTEDSGKKFGFIYDPNIQRVFSFSARYFVETFSEEKDKKKAIEKGVVQKLIKFQSKYFQSKRRQTELIAYIHEVWITDIGVTESIIQNLKNVIISEEFQDICNGMITLGSPSKMIDKEVLKKLEDMTNESLGGQDTDFPEGLIKDEEEEKEEGEEKESPKHKKKRNLFLEILPNLAVMLIFNTQDKDAWSLGDMIRVIKENDEDKKAIMHYIKTNLGENIPEIILDFFIQISDQDLDKNDTVRESFRQLKERFRASKGRDYYLLIEKYFVPFEVEKKDHGEVSTPMETAEKMLNTLPESFWSNKKVRLFEPCCGKGVFLFLTLERFMKGLKDKIPDEKKRKKFILEKMLYFADINPCNILFCKRLLDPGNDYNLNCHLGDSLELDIQKTFEIPKFTIIVSNPPYSTNPSLPNTKALYNLFVQKYIDKADYFLFITPSRWFGGGKGLDKFREFMLARKDIALIQHFSRCKDCFPTVNIEGGVSYFLKVPEETRCRFNGIEIKLSKYDILAEPEYIELIEKVKELPSIEEIFVGRGLLETNDPRIQDKKEKDDDVICHVSTKQPTQEEKRINAEREKQGKKKLTGVTRDRKRYAPKACLKGSSWKVITMRSNGNRKCFGFTTIISPEETYTGSYIGFRVGSREEGESLVSYLKCSIVNTLLGIRKISQDISEKTLKWIPLVPLDRIWDDESVKEYLGLISTEIFSYTEDGVPIYIEK